MANFCSNCGAKLGTDAKFCPNCGSKIGKSVSTGRNNFTENGSATARAKDLPGSRRAGAGKNESGRKKPERKKSRQRKRSGLSFLLAVIMVVEFLVAGFKYPGFLLPHLEQILSQSGNGGYLASKPGGFWGNTGGTSEGGSADILADDTANGSGEDAEEDILSISEEEAMEVLAGLSDEELQELSPGNPKHIQVHITEDEIRQVTPETAAVSPENPVAVFSDVTVNMKPWNLEGEDTLAFRSLGERRDEKSGRTMQVYDFELASGKNEFPGVVEITMPRAADGHADGVLYYNSRTQEWEPTCYEISDDGNYYTLLTDHFCIYCTTASDFCLTQTLESEIGAGVFCAMKLDEGEKYAVRNDMSPALDPGIASGTVDIGASATGFGYNDLLRRIYVCDDRLTQLYFNDADSSKFLRTLFAEGNLKQDTCIDYGIASFCGARDQLDAINSVKGIMGGQLFKGANPFFAFSATAVCSLKIMYLASKGESTQSIFAECGLDAASCVIALKGLSYAGGPVGAALFCIAVLSIYLLPKIYTNEKYHDGTMEGGTYRLYLNSMYRHPGTGKGLDLNGGGWADALSYELEHCDPKEADTVVEKLYDSYLNSFWELNAVDKYIVMQRYASINHRMLTQAYWRELSPERVDEITSLARGLLRENTREIVKDVYLKKVTEYVKKMKDNLNEVTIPYLNTYIVINAKDPAVPTFDKSLYAIKDLEAMSLSEIPFQMSQTGNAVIDQEMVTFDAVKTPVFWPANMSRSLYSTKVFRPVFQKDSDLIFACRRYYYLMFGGPKTLHFSGHPESGAPEVSKDFKVSVRQVGTITIDISVSDDSRFFDGDWWEEGETIGQRVIRIGISDDELYFRVNTDAFAMKPVITKDYTQSKDLLIFDAGRDLGGVVQIKAEDGRHISVTIDGTTRRFVKEDEEAASLVKFLGSWTGEADYTDEKGKQHHIAFVDTIAYGDDGHIRWREVTSEIPNRSYGVKVESYTLDTGAGVLTLRDAGVFKGGYTTYTLDGDDRLICTNGLGERYILTRSELVNYVQMPVRTAGSSPGSGGVVPTGAPTGAATLSIGGKSQEQTESASGTSSTIPLD